MAPGVDDGISGGRGMAGGLGTRQLHQHIRGDRKVGGDRGVGEVGGGVRGKLTGGRGRQIDGHGSRIEEGGGSNVTRSRRIGCSGFCINSQGDLFAPDSEDEDFMEDVALEGAPGMEVAADKVPGMEYPPGMELPPEVQARLQMVLAGIDPVYHDVFISLYKVMVPAFFKCN